MKKSIIGAFVFVVIASQNTLRAETVAATVANITGTAYVMGPSGQSKKVSKGETIPAGSSINTDAGSTMALKLVPGATTVVAPNTRITLATLDYSKAPDGTAIRRIKIALELGTLSSNLVKRDGTSDFKISTPKGVVSAPKRTTAPQGTVWRVSYSPEAGLSVWTVDGGVQILLPGGQTVDVPAGKVATSEGGTTTVTGAMSSEQVSAIIGAMEAAGFAPADGTGNVVDGGVDQDATFNNSTQNSNPANISAQPTVSPTR